MAIVLIGEFEWKIRARCDGDIKMRIKDVGGKREFK